MQTGQIRTQFLGDPQGILAAHAQIKAAQKEMEEGYGRAGKAGRQAFYDIETALGGGDAAARKFIESQKMMEQGWKELNSLGKVAHEITSQQTAEVEKLRRGFERLGQVGKQAIEDLKRATQEEAAISDAAFKQKWTNLDTLGAKTRYTIELMNQLGAASARIPGLPSGWDNLSGMGRDQLGGIRDAGRWSGLGAAGDATRLGLDAGRLGGQEPWREAVRSVISSRGGGGGGVDLRAHNDELRETNSLLGGWGRSLLGIASGYIGVQEAINLAMQARQKQIDLEDRARSSQRTYAEAMETIYKNVGADDAAFAFVQDDMTKVAREFGISDQKMLGNLYEYAISGAEGNAQRGSEVVRATIGANRFTLGSQGTGYATGINALMKAVPGLSATEASSMLQGLGEKSNIVQQSMMSEYLAPTGMAGIATSDLNKVSRLDVTREAMAGSATLASYAIDNEGRTASTNWNLFSAATNDFFKEKGLEDPGSAMRRIDWLAENSPEMLAELEGKIGGDSRLKPFVTLFAIRRDPEMRKSYESTLAGLDPKSGRHEKLAAKLPNLTPQSAVADISNMIETEGELAGIERTPEGLLSAGRAAYVDAQTELFSKRSKLQGQGVTRTFIGQGLDNWSLASSLTGDANELRARKAAIQAQRIKPVSALTGPNDTLEIKSATLDRLEALFDRLIKAMEAQDGTTFAVGMATAGLGYDQARRRGKG